MKKTLIFFLLFSTTTIYSQNKDIDSINAAAMKIYKISPNKAILILNKALIQAEKSKNNNQIGLSKNNLGIVLRDIGEFKKAKELSTEALNTTTDSITIASCFNNIGAVNRKLGLYEDALNSYLKALKIYENKSLFDRQATVNNNIGIVYSYLNLQEKALEYHLKAQKSFEELDNKKGLSETYNNIAIIHANNNNLDKALDYFKFSLDIEKSLDDKKGIAESANNVGAVYYYLRKLDSALVYFNYSIDIEKSIKNLSGVSASFNNVSEILIEYKKFDKAESYIDSAFQYAKTAKSSTDIENSYINYSALYEEKKEYVKALEYYKKYSNYKDSILNQSNIKSIQEVETKYQTEKKEKEIAVQKEELLKQKLEIKNKNLFAVLLASGLLILGLILYLINKKKEQLGKEIKLKDELSKTKTQNKLQEQRLRISRDLHDNIGSQLTFIISSIDNLKFLVKSSDDKLKTKLTSINNFATNTISQLRDTIWAMNKNEITFEDFYGRILGLIEKAKIAKSDIKYNLNSNVKSNIVFSSVNGINIFRVLQEIVNNALKYANASQIDIDISEQENTLDITVKDNGKGFDIKTIEFGNGLENMQRRIEEINGEIGISSELNKGTAINIRIDKNTTNAV